MIKESNVGLEFWVTSDSNFQAQSSSKAPLKWYNFKAHSLRSILKVVTPFTQ